MTAIVLDKYMPHPEEARRAVSIRAGYPPPFGRREHYACCPCFETLAALAHQVVG